MRLHYGGDFDIFFFFFYFFSFFLLKFTLGKRAYRRVSSLVPSISPYHRSTLQQYETIIYTSTGRRITVLREKWLNACPSLVYIFLSFPFLSSFSFPLPPFPIPFLFRYAHRRFFRHFTPGYAQLSFDQLRVDRIEDRTFATQNSSLARIRSRYFDSSRQRSLYIFSSRSRKFSLRPKRGRRDWYSFDEFRESFARIRGWSYLREKTRPSSRHTGLTFLHTLFRSCEIAYRWLIDTDSNFVGLSAVSAAGRMETLTGTDRYKRNSPPSFLDNPLSLSRGRVGRQLDKTSSQELTWVCTSFFLSFFLSKGESWKVDS